MRMENIETISAVGSRDFYEQFVRPRVPVIIDRMAPWPALDRWSIEMFRTRFSDREVPIGGVLRQLGPFLDEVEGATTERPSAYLNQVPVGKYFPELEKDLLPVAGAMLPNWLSSPVIPKRAGTRDGFCELFIGGAGAGFSQLHFDSFYVNTYITQIVGPKDFTLFSPEDTQNLYPEPGRPNLSRIQDLSTATSEFPNISRARPIEVRVHPGETLFVPWGFWHASRLSGPSIAVAASTANSENWTLFRDDFSASGNALRRMAKKSVLTVAGWFEGYRTQ